MASGHGKDKSSAGHSVMSISSDLARDLNAGLHFAESSETNPDTVLNRMLSTKSVISTSSSFAERQNRVQDAENILGDASSRNFTKIGSGNCGEVFQQPGTAQILKRAKKQERTQELWDDYRTHVRVQKALSKMGLLDLGLRVPQVKHFIDMNDKSWWEENGSKFPQESQALPEYVSLTNTCIPLLGKTDCFRYLWLSVYCRCRR